MGDGELVKLVLRFKPAEDLPVSEGLWARPIEANDAGGVFELENSSFLVPLSAGDRVRAQLDGDGRLQIVDLAGPADALLTVVHAFCTGDALQAMVDRWAEQGAVWTEGNAGYMVTTWRTEMSQDEVGRVLRPDLDAGRGEWLTAAGPGDRGPAALGEVDFALDTDEHLPPVQTDYWVGEDPYWESIGMSDPEFLAFVQTLAGREARVARALERGQQDRVMRYIERITAPDPRALPPLDGPIFDPD